MNYLKIAELLERLADEFRDATLPPKTIPALDSQEAVDTQPPKIKAEPIKLPLIQAVGRDLIQAGKQARLKSYLNDKGLKNLSSALESDYEEIYHGLLALSYPLRSG
jgi:hypothetical protein